MMTASNPRLGRGFALIELLACVLMLGVLMALLLVSGSDTRRQARMGECIGNLKQFGAATPGFAADNQDRVWTFSWRKGESNSQFPDLNNATTDMEAAANQAVDIIRRRVGPEMPRIPGWIPHLLYSHLVLADYLDTRLPQQYAVCPEDLTRLCWSEDALTACVRCGPGGSCEPGFWFRRATTTSYELPPSFFSPDSRTAQYNTIAQASSFGLYFVPGNMPIGRRRMGEVINPAQKVLLFEYAARHFGPRPAFYAYPEARLPVLFADGAVGVRVTGDSNPGGRPNDIKSPDPTTFVYNPSASLADLYPPPLSGQPSDTLTGHYRWTRGGLRGRDFGGAEVPY